MGKFFCLAAGILGILLTGCWSNMDYHRMFDAGKNAVKAGTVTDKELAESTLQMRRHMDTASEVAPENSKYVKRLNKLMADQKDINGTPLNYKVYMNPELNANVTPDGSIRVYSGLMDAMNDDELRFVLGHELGHVAQGHSLKHMRMVYATAAAKSAAGATNPYAALATDSDLGDLAREFVHAQYDQSQELDADSYGLNYLKSKNGDPNAATSAMRKLGASGGGFFDTHPSNETRVKNLEALKQGADPKTLRTDS